MLNVHEEAFPSIFDDHGRSSGSPVISPSARPLKLDVDTVDPAM